MKKSNVKPSINAATTFVAAFQTVTTDKEVKEKLPSFLAASFGNEYSDLSPFLQNAIVAGIYRQLSAENAGNKDKTEGRIGILTRFDQGSFYPIKKIASGSSAFIGRESIEERLSSLGASEYQLAIVKGLSKAEFNALIKAKAADKTSLVTRAIDALASETEHAIADKIADLDI